SDVRRARRRSDEECGGVTRRQADQHERQRDDEPEKQERRCGAASDEHHRHASIMSARRNASILTIGAVLACAGPVRPADVVVSAPGTDLESANPLVTIHPLSRQVQRHVLFVTLARYDEALRPTPYFARQWQWSVDRRALDLVLLRRLTWDDGVPTSAEDVVFTIDRARDPRTGYARAADLAGIGAVVATSDTGVRITFTSSQRDLPPIFCELPI